MGRIAYYECRGGLQEKHTMRMLRRICHEETPADLEHRMSDLLWRVQHPAPAIVIPFPVGRKARKRSSDVGPFNPFDGGPGGGNGGQPMPAPGPAPEQEEDESTRAA